MNEFGNFIFSALFLIHCVFSTLIDPFSEHWEAKLNLNWGESSPPTRTNQSPTFEPSQFNESPNTGPYGNWINEIEHIQNKKSTKIYEEQKTKQPKWREMKKKT